MRERGGGSEWRGNEWRGDEGRKNEGKGNECRGMKGERMRGSGEWVMYIYKQQNSANLELESTEDIYDV